MKKYRWHDICMMSYEQVHALTEEDLDQEILDERDKELQDRAGKIRYIKGRFLPFQVEAVATDGIRALRVSKSCEGWYLFVYDYEWKLISSRDIPGNHYGFKWTWDGKRTLPGGTKIKSMYDTFDEIRELIKDIDWYKELGEEIDESRL